MRPAAGIHRHAGRRPDAPPGISAATSASPRHRPCTIVLDNASTHVSRRIKDALPQLEEHGITFFYLPLCSPELNKAERVWRSVKYEDIPIRAYPGPTPGSKNSRPRSSRLWHSETLCSGQR
ncbi:transposase [Streptomyces sp. NPDC056480]|uniref:transposase n=1 Tax=Streptomyces sp. NPDC056480 TaxID=3345833 RepID=UPI0036BE9D44